MTRRKFVTVKDLKEAIKDLNDDVVIVVNDIPENSFYKVCRINKKVRGYIGWDKKEHPMITLIVDYQ